jgi:hypothetical protein
MFALGRGLALAGEMKYPALAVARGLCAVPRCVRVSRLRRCILPPLEEAEDRPSSDSGVV